MYEAFDRFMEIDTWHTMDSNDEMRFFRALDLIVWSPDFNPENMVDHMRANENIPSDDFDSGFARAIDRYRDKAWAVKDFIKYTNLRKPRSSGLA
jgi:hypothetical protein